jgi:hypothetical protein
VKEFVFWQARVVRIRDSQQLYSKFFVQLNNSTRRMSEIKENIKIEFEDKCCSNAQQQI